MACSYITSPLRLAPTSIFFLPDYTVASMHSCGASVSTYFDAGIFSLFIESSCLLVEDFIGDTGGVSLDAEQLLMNYSIAKFYLCVMKQCFRGLALAYTRGHVRS